ncbi:kynurenine formamidase [Halohasta litchfieldiae]|jgi:kynurenine formamidase|uniref:Kynurenine formamidase n=1 Tax=Halohasta litchfieldiae TaxID=1073996 RepID=A0A1H6X760_9EURY|nr:cyclase family protein [Halohasta litchfieldiae]ATW90032.1 kynurenine formamidase [Halohasta litchfieldiae]SEJ24908.1 Kynurenine formamidase [Halohasta litchfieldiae]
MPSYDLSHPIESDMCVYPDTPPVRVEPTATVESDGYRTTSIVMDSHAGTHVDAPAHMLEDGTTIDQLPVETFQFETRLVDCRPLDPRAAIDGATITAALGDGGIEEAVDLLVIQTGWDDHWGTDQYFDHPYLTAEAAEWLAKRGLHLGIDALNVDPTPTDNATPDEPVGYPVHHALFSSDRLLVENLRGLGRLPSRFELHAYPVPIRDGDAAPVRAVAVVTDTD